MSTILKGVYAQHTSGNYIFYEGATSASGFHPAILVLSKEGAEPRVKTEAQFKALEDRVGELAKYAQHKDDCDVGKMDLEEHEGRTVGRSYPCTCGLDELLNPKV